MVEKRGRYLEFAIDFKVYHALALLLTEKYHIPQMGLVVLRGNCPTNRGSCPIWVIVQGVDVPGGSCPGGVIGRGVVVN